MKTPYSGIPRFAFLFSLLGSGFAAKAQYTFTDSNLTPYTQNFDAMTGRVPFSYGTTAVPELLGLYAETQADPQFGSGSLFPTGVSANDGSVITGYYYHFGKTDETDRAFGGIAETGMYTGKAYAGIRLKNGTSATIQNLEIQYAMEQWYNSGNAAAAYVNVSYRKSSSTPNENMASLSTGAIGDAWTPVPALTVEAPSTGTVIQSRDGNSPANRRVVQTTLADINILPGQEIMIRWDYVLNPTTNGNGVSIDDVVITPQTSVFFAEGAVIGAPATGGRGTTTALEWYASSGATPATLDAPNRTYYVTGAVSAASLANISGANTKVIIGVPAQNGAQPQAGLLTLEDATALGVPVDVTAGSTLRIEEGAASTPVTFGMLAPASTVVYAGSTVAHTIKAASYGRLTLEGTGAKTLAGPILVNGNLRLSGAKLSLAAFDATITKGSQVVGAGAASYVVTSNGGRLRQSVLSDNAEVVFPVGTAATYLPVTLQQSQTRSEDVFAVRVADTKYATYDNADAGIGSQVEATKGVRNTWFVSEEVKNNANLTVKLQWQEADQSADFEPTKAFVSHFHNGFWDRTVQTGAVPVAGSANTYTVSRSNISSFSPFSVSSDASQPLPVELVSFTAQRVSGAVSCTWITASETNNKHFQVERSLDARTFSVIGTVQGAGTSTARHTYSFPDQRPVATTAYYRLRQVDTNNKVSHSPVVVVQGTGAGLAITAAPNPTAGTVALSLTLAEATTVRGTVTNLLGRKVAHFTRTLPAGLQSVPVDLSSQPAGVYLLRVQMPQGTQTLRVIKQQ